MAATLREDIEKGMEAFRQMMERRNNKPVRMPEVIDELWEAAGIREDAARCAFWALYQGGELNLGKNYAATMKA